MTRPHFFTCEEESCPISCHKKKECSGINRGIQDKKWLCPSHNPDILEENNTRTCSVCKGAIRFNSNPMKCPECEKLSHKACSGIPTQDKELQWRCEEHFNGDILAFICFKCKHKFAKNADTLKCTHCERRCHKAPTCSGISKGTKYKIWNCGNHGEEPSPVDLYAVFPICVNCNQPVRTAKKNPKPPLTCNEPGCSRVSCRQEKCCGIKMNWRKENYGLDGFWNCGIHQSEESEHQPVASEEVATERELVNTTSTSETIRPSCLSVSPQHDHNACHKCKKRFRANADPLICLVCGIKSHRGTKCSEVSRQATRINEWRCPSHTQTPSEQLGEYELQPEDLDY